MDKCKFFLVIFIASTILLLGSTIFFIKVAEKNFDLQVEASCAADCHYILYSEFEIKENRCFCAFPMVEEIPQIVEVTGEGNVVTIKD